MRTVRAYLLFGLTIVLDLGCIASPQGEASHRPSQAGDDGRVTLTIENRSLVPVCHVYLAEKNELLERDMLLGQQIEPGASRTFDRWRFAPQKYDLHIGSCQGELLIRDKTIQFASGPARLVLHEGEIPPADARGTQVFTAQVSHPDAARQAADTASSDDARPKPAAVDPPSSDDAKPKPAVPSTADLNPAKLEAAIRQVTQGMRPDGKPIKGTLNAFHPVGFHASRGRCYAMTLRLEPGAEWSEDLRKGEVVFVAGDMEIVGDLGVRGPGAAATAGCPEESVDMLIDVRPSLNSPLTQARDLGHGNFVLQLYSQRISEAELRKQREAGEREKEKSKARARRACDACRRERDFCLDRIRVGIDVPLTSCGDSYMRCLQGKGVLDRCP